MTLIMPSHPIFPRVIEGRFRYYEFGVDVDALRMSMVGGSGCGGFSVSWIWALRSWRLEVMIMWW